MAVDQIIAIDYSSNKFHGFGLSAVYCIIHLNNAYNHFTPSLTTISLVMLLKLKPEDKLRHCVLLQLKYNTKLITVLTFSSLYHRALLQKKTRYKTTRCDFIMSVIQVQRDLHGLHFFAQTASAVSARLCFGSAPLL